MNTTENEFFPQDAIKEAETAIKTKIQEQEDAMFTQKTIKTAESQESKKDSMADEIANLQKELKIEKRVTPKKSQTYNDFFNEYGDETWYVKNLTNQHIVLDIEEMDKIEKNLTVDLLSMTDMESIKASKALRKCLNEGVIKRITPSEFLLYLKEVAEKKRKADTIIAKELGEDVEEEVKVRNVVITKVEKYKMYTNSANKDQGISTVDFVAWLISEKLNSEEIEYCLSGTVDNDIRNLLISKRQELITSA